MADEGYTQVAPNSTGDKIRDLSVTAVQPDGTLATVKMQVVAVADESGRPVDFGALDELLWAARRQLAATLLLLQAVGGVRSPTFDDVDQLAAEL